MVHERHGKKGKKKEKKITLEPFSFLVDLFASTREQKSEHDSFLPIGDLAHKRPRNSFENPSQSKWIRLSHLHSRLQRKKR